VLVTFSLDPGLETALPGNGGFQVGLLLSNLLFPAFQIIMQCTPAQRQ